MTDEQLKAMEASAPLLVDAYRRQRAELDWATLAYNDVNERNGLLFQLTRDLLYTVRSGVIAYSNVTSLTERAKELGVKVP